ncbi:MAG: metallopeptidase family protein [Patescibacteria group bacterium]
MDDNKFRKLVKGALDSLPKEFAEKLNNVSVTVDNFPTPYQLRKAKIPPYALLFGLYEGVPQTKRGVYYSHIPDKITIFKNSIEKVARTEEEVRVQVRATVIHEIGHHFGLSEEELRE